MKRYLNYSNIILGRLVFIQKSIAKGISYMIIAYPFVQNWYDAALYRGTYINACSLRLRDRDLSKTLMVKLMQLFTGNVSFSSTKLTGNRVPFKYKNRLLYFSFSDSKSLAQTFSSINEQFLEEQYKDLDCAECTVIDIGAGVGDTAIYFALNGAKKVMAFEPYPYTFEIAKANVRINRLSGKITLINAACGLSKGSAVLDPDFHNTDRDSVHLSKGGKKIRIYGLDEIAGRYGKDDPVLKIDCEGCEYALILKTDEKVLRKFSQIILEYHFGFEDLESKLKACGFSVRHTLPVYMPKDMDKRDSLFGLIVARRIGS